MNSGESPYIFYYVLLIVLVASSLIGMRLPLRKAAKMILAWVAIFGAVFVIVAFRGDGSGASCGQGRKLGLAP